LESEKADFLNPFSQRRFVMKNVTVPSEYLLRDPKKLDSLKIGEAPEPTRHIDPITRVKLADIACYITGAMELMLTDEFVHGKLADRVKNIRIVHGKLTDQVRQLMRVSNEAMEGMLL
jgi:hypothetical protein